VATEWEGFLSTWEREYQTTMKVLRNFPADMRDFKPHEKSRTAANLAEGFIVEERFLLMVLKGKLDFEQLKYENPGRWEDILSEYEKVHVDTIRKAKRLGKDAFRKTMMFPARGGKMEKRKRGELAWMMLYDFIHHRGQFSVYLRMVGGKVPAIYGPSLDEPW
jgi:uncharacterized damage-inducible protein DinB